MDIRLAESPEEIVLVRQLWREYWDSFGLAADFQGFAEELAGLPGLYGQSGGALLVALDDQKPAGTVALRRLNATSGEVKRLFLRPEYRGQGLGRRLLEAIIERAIALEYQCLYADTLPVMMDALSLYAKAGFERTEPYSATPTPGAIYLKRMLVAI